MSSEGRAITMETFANGDAADLSDEDYTYSAHRPAASVSSREAESAELFGQGEERSLDLVMKFRRRRCDGTRVV